MLPFDFIKLIFGTWYIAHAVTGTHGPLGVFEWMREKLPHGRRNLVIVTGVANEAASYTTQELKRLPGLLDCIICLAPWVALALLMLQVVIVRDVLAVAGGALLLHSFTGWRFGE